MNEKLRESIEKEIAEAERLSAAGDLEAAFGHLERAHVLGQSSTFQHTRVHTLMLKNGLKRRDAKEVLGQTMRIVGASTKTPFGIYPAGNTGGANVSPFRPMPIADDLRSILEEGKK